MTKRERILARQGLKDLRLRFEQAALNSDVKCGLFCTTDETHRMALVEPPFSLVRSKSVTIREWGAPSSRNLTRVYFDDSSGAISRFHELFSAAYCLWESLQPDASEEQITADRGIDWSREDISSRFRTWNDLAVPRWVLVVYSLAWKKYRGTSLKTDRKIWDPNWPILGHHTLPYEQDLRRRALQAESQALRDYLEAEQAEPDYFFSELPDNLFHCSISAIDLILKFDPAFCRSRLPPEAGPPGTEIPERPREEVSQPLVMTAVETRERSIAPDQTRGRARARVSLAIRETLVADVFSENSTATIELIGQKENLGKSSIHDTDAWKNRQARPFPTSEASNFSSEQIEHIMGYFLNHSDKDIKKEFRATNDLEKELHVLNFINDQASLILELLANDQSRRNQLEALRENGELFGILEFVKQFRQEGSRR